MVETAKQPMDPSMLEMEATQAQQNRFVAPNSESTVVYTRFRVTDENRPGVLDSIQQIAQYQLAPDVVKRSLENLGTGELEDFLVGFRGTEALGLGMIRVLNGRSGLGVTRGPDGREIFTEKDK